MEISHEKAQKTQEGKQKYRQAAQRFDFDGTATAA
jgi:hypothetical protein